MSGIKLKNIVLLLSEISVIVSNISMLNSYKRLNAGVFPTVMRDDRDVQIKC